MTKTLNWYLAMEFHLEPSSGHGTGKSADCSECKRIMTLVVKAGLK